MGLLQRDEAEGVGFEPTEPFWGSPLFESGTLNHSDTLPPGSIAQLPNSPQAVDDPFSYNEVAVLRDSQARVAGSPASGG